MKKFIIILTLLITSTSYAQETISNLQGDERSAILDEELRKLRKDIDNSSGQCDATRYLPMGGNQHQVLSKSSDTNYAVEWNDIDSLITMSTGQCIGSCNSSPVGTAGNAWSEAATDAAYEDMTDNGALPFKFKKTSNINTLIFYMYVWIPATQPHTFKVMCGGLSSGSYTTGSATPVWSDPLHMDVSSLTNGTVYDVTIWVKHEGVGGAAYCSAVIGFNHD